MIDQSVPFGKNILLKVLNFFSQSIHFFFHFSSEVKKSIPTWEEQKPQKEKDQEKAQQFVF